MIRYCGGSRGYEIVIDKVWGVMVTLAVEKILWVCGCEGGERAVGEDLIFGVLCVMGWWWV